MSTTAMLDVEEVGAPGAATSTVLAVCGLEGGLGASSLAAHCAWWFAASRGGERRPVVLVDLDISGAGLGVLLGIEDIPGLRWGDVPEPGLDLAGEHLLRALPRWGEVAVLTTAAGQRTEIDAQRVGVVLEAVARHSVVVVDLPGHRWFDDVGGVVRQQQGAWTAWLTGCSVTGVAAALSARSIDRAQALVVRTTSGRMLSPADVAGAVDVPVCAVVGHRRRMARAVEWGRGPLDSRAWPRTGSSARQRAADGAELPVYKAAGALCRRCLGVPSW